MKTGAWGYGYAVMNAKILCTWLGLADKQWPPDHFALLGLPPGMSDMVQIEKTVQDRMAKLRCYQLSHPDEATEGMNRVAQAFICLMEAAARPAPKRPMPSVIATARLPQKNANGRETSVKPVDKVPPSKEETLVAHKTEVNWKVAPPPVRATPSKNDAPSPQETDAVSAIPPAPDPVRAEITPYQATSVAPMATVQTAAYVTMELAQESPEARRGLGTLDALVDRIYATRHLLIAWNEIGRCLKWPTDRASRPAKDAELTRPLGMICERIKHFPPIIGHPGKPGYRVAAMARLGMTGQMLKMLDETQRDCLERDWEAGRRVLLSHRQFLRRHFKTVRQRGAVGQIIQAVRAAINDHPGRVLLGILLVAALLAFLYGFVF